jgi:hypothetical protein
MAPAEDSKRQNATQLHFPKLFKFREVGTQVSLATMSHLSLRTAAPSPCLPLDIKDSMRFFGGGLIEGFLMGDGLICWQFATGLPLNDAAGCRCCC